MLNLVCTFLQVGSQSTSATNVKSGNPATAATLQTQAPSSQQSKAISNSSVLNNKSNVVNNVPASTASALPPTSSGSNTTAAVTSAVPPAPSTGGTSTPIKTAFNTMVANPNNSSPSSGVTGLNGSATQITSASASAVTALATSSGSPAASSASSMMPPPGLSQPTAGLQQPLPQTPLQAEPQQQPNFAAAVQQLNGKKIKKPLEFKAYL